MAIEIGGVIDASGSMSTLTAETISGYNDFLREQGSMPGDVRVTTVTFSSTTTFISRGTPLASAARLSTQNYHASGYTALYDAIGDVIVDIQARVAYSLDPAKPVICIITDGAENASKRYTLARINQMITDAQLRGWTFVFLGANINAFTVGEGLGVAPQNRYQYTASAAGTAEAYSTMTRATLSARMTP